jgi:hypothetical protein
LTGFSESLFHRTGGSHRARLAHSQLVLEQAQPLRNLYLKFLGLFVKFLWRRLNFLGYIQGASGNPFGFPEAAGVKNC